MRKPKGIIYRNQKVLEEKVRNLLQPFPKWQQIVEKSYFISGNRGRAYLTNRVITIPYTAHKRSDDFFTYYVAHEISHLIAYKHYKSGVHDKHFYRIFKKLCPKNYQHYELDYIKRSKNYGIN